MSAAQALKAARAAGIELDIDGDDLLWAAPEQPPTAVLDLLARHKTGIVRLLRSGGDGSSAEDWQAFFDERAGIAEFDGGLPRGQAEEPKPSPIVKLIKPPPEGCHMCGFGDIDGDSLGQFDDDDGGCVWLHQCCWRAWKQGLRFDACCVCGESCDGGDWLLPYIGGATDGRWFHKRCRNEFVAGWRAKHAG
jgi:hypothetical protein